MSNEETIENPKYLPKSYEKLIKAQRRLSSKTKGSKIIINQGLNLLKHMRKLLIKG